MPNDIHQELLRLIALNYAEQWVPNPDALAQLERYGDRLIPELIECLGDSDSEVRQLAVGLLDEAGLRAGLGLPALIEAVADPDQLVRIAAAHCLEKFGPQAVDAVPGLRRLMDDTHERFIRIIAAGAIRHIVPKDPVALAVLVEALGDPVGIHRSTGCEYLGETGDRDSVLRVMPLLSDPEFPVRFAAGVAIGRKFNHWFHAVAVCVAMLKDADELIRTMGKECMLSLGPHAKADIDLLTMAMVDAAPDVRLDMQETLDELRKQ